MMSCKLIYVSGYKFMITIRKGADRSHGLTSLISCLDFSVMFRQNMGGYFGRVGILKFAESTAEQVMKFFVTFQVFLREKLEVTYFADVDFFWELNNKRGVLRGG